MGKPIILIINRWNDELACYEQYVDHHLYDVIYLTNPSGLEKIRRSLAKAVYVTNDLDHCAFESKLNDFLLKHNPIDKIIAFSEVDQELAAYLRTKWSVPGINVNEVKKFRNKIIMKQVAQAADIKTPLFFDLNLSQDFITKGIHYPVILKPKDGVSSEGVHKVQTKDQFNILINKINQTNYQCEQFIDGTIYHADGLVQNGKIILCKISEYINTCFSYTLGTPLGSVLLDDEDFLAKANQFTNNVIKAFSLNDGAFHLEFIFDQNNEFYFLEIGARVGGAQVPYVFKNIYGIDIFKEWVNIQFGKNVSLVPNVGTESFIGGWLLFPQPTIIPSKVEFCQSLKESISFILSEKLPTLGHVFKGNGEYRDVSGIYLFKARSTNEVKNAIQQTIQQFCIQTSPIKGE